jgi:hypothetical protein
MALSEMKSKGDWSSLGIEEVLTAPKSRSDALITMVKAAEFCDFDDGPMLHNRTLDRALLLERKMTTRLMGQDGLLAKDRFFVQLSRHIRKNSTIHDETFAGPAPLFDVASKNCTRARMLPDNGGDMILIRRQSKS